MGLVERIGTAGTARRGRVDTTVRELVEWTYAVQCADRGGDLGAGGYAGISQTGIVMEIGALGCLVDRSAGGAHLYGSTQCADDALTVHGLVECLPARYRLALLHNGRSRSIPDWSPHIEPLCVVPVPGRKGAAKGIYSQSGNLIACEITYCGDIPDRWTAHEARWHWPDMPHLRCVEDVIDHARRVYSEWYLALCELASSLGGLRLDAWRVAGVGARAEPWLNNS
jgi:hypothetical protein